MKKQRPFLKDKSQIEETERINQIGIRIRTQLWQKGGEIREKEEEKEMKQLAHTNLAKRKPWR